MNTFDNYRGFLSSLPVRDQYGPGDLLVPDLLMAVEGALRMFYAPFDWANESARLIILGITPGWTQMELACRTARVALLEGRTADEACRTAKQQASFAGPMRNNLIGMLDTLGIPDLLNVESTADLFGRAARLPHFLLRVAREFLVPELESVPDAAIVPLGRSVEEVLEILAAEGSIKRKRWLSGFPHPSGANGHRARVFEDNRSSLARQLHEILGTTIAARSR